MLDLRHPFFPKFKELAAEAAARSPVYDLGTSARFAKEVGLVRDLFDERSYFACGFRPDNLLKPGGCDIDCDIQSMPDVATGTVGSVLCLEVLEHVQRPRDAAREIFRILKPGGIAIVGVPFLISYHGKSSRLDNPLVNGVVVDSRHDSYGDYWRYTHEGLALLFAEAGFARVDVYPVDGWLISRLQMLNLYRFFVRIPGVLHLIKALDRPRLGRATTLHFMRAEKAA